MDYVKIPQNIRIEDKLIGPLSLRQIVIIAMGGGVSYALYAMVSKSFGVFPPVAHAFVWLPLIFCAAFSLIRINDITLTRYSLLVFELMVKPRKRVWQPRRGVNTIPRAQMPKKTKHGKEDSEKSKARPPMKLKDLNALLAQGEKNQDLAAVQQSGNLLESTMAEQTLSDASENEMSEHGARLDKIWQEMKEGTAHSHT